MTELTKLDVEKVAYLARIAIDESEIPVYIKNLKNILHLVEKMNAIDTSHIEPMSHPLHIHQPLREDIPSEKNQRELFLSIAPLVKAGLYLVPKVIE